MPIAILKVNRIEYTDVFIYQSELFLRLHLVWMTFESFLDLYQKKSVSKKIAFFRKSHQMYEDFHLSWKGYKTLDHVNLSVQ